jgi:UDP-N-acetylglucosamine 4,6-dehydratase/5-epimerase
MKAKSPALDLSYLDGRSILITGGTGSFGKRFTQALLSRTKVKKIIILSRDEFKQSEMAAALDDKRVRYFLGDVRDAQRLQRAFHGVDYVVHAAALKQVPKLEYDPFEAVQTNIIGAQNIINAAIDQGVKKVVALSTDKAANPVNLYGATKLCAEKLFIASNSYAGKADTRFSVTRYGNVVGSRGSVVPLFLQKRKTGVLPLTDERMTRFWITLDGGVDLVFSALTNMKGGEIFVPKIPSMKMTDLAKAMGPDCKIKVIGIRPGEKLHETLLSVEEATHALDCGGFFVVKPDFPWWSDDNWTAGAPLPAGFSYASDNNEQWLTEKELHAMVDSFTASESTVRA